MGNGGGGTVIFGLDEEPETSIAKCLTPLPSANIVGVIEDIVRSAVRPPLLWSHDTFEADGGCVVVADIEASPLGPYMVEAYGDQRYYKRISRSVHAMSEQEVRDAYSLAHRSGERRSQVWADHDLPMHALNEHPWIVVSAVPEEPLSPIMDQQSIDLTLFRIPPPLAHYMSQTELEFAIHGMRHWADGLTADDGFDAKKAECVLRLHRDGAAGIAQAIRTEIEPEWIARMFNCFLIYLAWFWEEFQLRRPLGLELGIEGLAPCTLPQHAFSTSQQAVVHPVGMEVNELKLVEQILPWELGRASVRHRILRRVCDGLERAFGSPSASAMFERGWLYTKDGFRSGLALDRGMIWNPVTNVRVTGVDVSGRIRHPGTGEVCAYVLDGVVLDEAGDTLATLEMAQGAGCPDDFIPRIEQISSSPLAQPVEPEDSEPLQDPLSPTGSWSGATIVEILGP